MISADTLFVVGAGASNPYGFPLGGALADRIVNGLCAPGGKSELWNLATAALFEEDLIRSFCEDYRESGCYSIDAFLNSRREYVDLAKFAIAASLIPFEAPDKLKPQQGDWYRYLFDKILPAEPCDLGKCNLRILTFNFDRSFEERMFRMLRARWGVSPERAAEAVATIPLLHVHGDLGLPMWSTADGYRRAYSAEIPPLRELQACAERIAIVHEGIQPTIATTIGEFFSRSEAICFLGFGYHPLNLAKLGVPKSLEGKKRITGTTFKMPEGEIGWVTGAVPKIAFERADALGFLESTAVVNT
jgi:hypothetical protein